MGFFDKLKKIIGGAINSNEKTSQNTPNEQPRQSYSNVEPTYKDHNYFKQVILSLYPNYAVLEKQNIDVLGAPKTWDFNHISFVIKDRSEVKGVVIVIPNGKKGKNRPYKEVKEYCANNNIVYLAFYLHLENKDAYVKERISKAIK
jgi:hypothetical protein